MRLQRAGGAAELAAAFQDSKLGWEPREQAVGLLQDLAAALAQVRCESRSIRCFRCAKWVCHALLSLTSRTPLHGSACVLRLPGMSLALQMSTPKLPLLSRLQDGVGEEGAAAVAATATSAASPSSAPPSGAAVRQEWADVVLPALVDVLKQTRGEHMRESKEAAAAVLAKFAGNGPSYAAAVGCALACPGSRMQELALLSCGEGGERRGSGLHASICWHVLPTRVAAASTTLHSSRSHFMRCQCSVLPC